MTIFLTAGILAIPALFLVLAGMFGKRWAIAVFFCALLFISEASFRTRDITDPGMDWQVVLKLGMWIGAACIAAGNLRGSARELVRGPLPLLLVFLLYGSVSVIYSPDRLTSIASIGTTWFAFLFALCLSMRVSWKQAVGIALVGFTVYLAVSLMLYFVAPDIAQHRHIVRIGGLEYHRLKGLAHPNPVGWISALTVGIAIFLAHEEPRWRGLCVIAAFVGAAALLLAYSRTAMLAFVGALVVVTFRQRFWLGASLALSGVFVVIGLLLFGWQPDLSEILVSASRSGANTTELATLTGRTVLWVVVVQMILRAPILGYGFAANRSMLVNTFRGADFIPDQAHNQYLNVWLNGGLIGLSLFVAIFVKQLQLLFRCESHIAAFAFAFLAISGIAEAYLLSGLPSAALMLWFLLLVYHRRLV